LLKMILAAAMLALMLLPSSSRPEVIAAGVSQHLYGQLCVDDSCGAEAYDLTVIAKIGDIECGSAVSGPHIVEVDGLAMAWFDMDVAAYEEIPGCGTEGATVDVFVDGRQANEQAQWSPFETGLWVSVGDYAYLSGYIMEGEEYYRESCVTPCDGPLLTAYLGNTECGVFQAKGTREPSIYRWLAVAGAEARSGCPPEGPYLLTFTVDGIPARVGHYFERGFGYTNLVVGARSAHFHGNACVDSNCGQSEIGLPVVARIGDVVCGETETAFPISDGQVQSLYDLLVAPTEKIPGCGTEGAAIDFYIDGRKAKQTATWHEGGLANLNLWVGPDFAAFRGYTNCNGKPCYNCFDPCSTATIQAYIGDELCGQHNPLGWLIGNSYGPLIVLSDEQQAGCGTPGTMIHFKINNLDVVETALWEPGFRELSLTGGDVIWGDTDCTRQLSPADALRIVAYKAGFYDGTNCFQVTQPLQLTPFELVAEWGDFDCSGGHPTLLDAIKLLSATSFGQPQQEAGCPPPSTVIRGHPVFVAPGGE
jgi:hypothetical protein